MEINKIYHEDCLDTMSKMPSNFIDCILTDPPFFTPAAHYQSRISWGRCWGDLSILGEFFFTIAKEFKRVLKPKGNIFVFCHDESYPVFYPVCYGLWDFTRCLIWNKTRVGLGKIFRHQHEMILWASNSGAMVYNDGKLHSDILTHAPTLSRNRKHPVEKPVSLLEELLTVATKQGDLIYDGFVGGGSTIIAAMQMKRKFIGSDIDRKYVELVNQRLRESLFPCTTN